MFSKQWLVVSKQACHSRESGNLQSFVVSKQSLSSFVIRLSSFFT